MEICIHRNTKKKKEARRMGGGGKGKEGREKEKENVMDPFTPEEPDSEDNSNMIKIHDPIPNILPN